MKQIIQVIFTYLIIHPIFGQNNEKETIVSYLTGQDNVCINAFLGIYRIENGKFILILIFLALYIRKVIQKVGELIISLNILHQNQSQQQIPENDEYYRKYSIVKQLKKIVKYLKRQIQKNK